MIPNNSLEILEFNKVLNLISNYANSEASKKSILSIRPLSDKNQIEKKQHEISEIRKMAHEGKPIALSSFHDITQFLLKVKPEGSVLEAQELALFIPVFDIGYSIFFQIRDRFDLPNLRAITLNITGFPDILKILIKSIDSEGNILDSASPLLSELRAKIRKLELKIRKRLEEIVRDEKISSLLQDDFITVRSGRWVIPVRMDSKGMVPGVVHDVSKSGETAFIEPLAVIHLSNEIENFIAEQKAEEIRILRNISSMIRKEINKIEEEFNTIVYLDTLNCIAKFSDLLNMQNPIINTSRIINLIDARHPLLQISYQKQGANRTIVPLNAQLGGENTIMVITGANAGGKTIAIKTIGLIVLMAISGMPIPASSTSNIPLIENLLVDIGDEQSIENNLSTFSAHISNLSSILKDTNSETIVLIDELGTGTDPEEGAAISCAILKELREKNSLVFATTHLAEIKGFVHTTEGMLNASMEFDIRTFTPLYKLRIGEPGQSHAIEIAKRYGLPDPIIAKAKDMLGNIKTEFDRLVSELNEKRNMYENLLIEIEEEKKQLESLRKNIDKQIKDIEIRNKEILAEAYKKSYEIIFDTKRQMNTFLDELKKKGKSEARKIIKEIEEKQKLIEDKLAEYSEAEKSPAIEELKKGDMVYVKSLKQDALITDINPKSRRLKILSGNIEIEVPISEISAKKDIEMKETQSSVHVSSTEDVPFIINVVGKRVDKAISEIEKTLNHASLTDMPEITVIHGIGKGILMKAIHEHLTKHPLVKKFRSASQDEGGKAKTIVTLK
ncbi:MAG: endonuclease MutS2 [Nitrospirae bacterium]|nr:endonuclease MutS2 [Nitrospirota bacterium]